MADVTIVSSSDTPEQVTAALTDTPLPSEIIPAPDRGTRLLDTSITHAAPAVEPVAVETASAAGDADLDEATSLAAVAPAVLSPAPKTEAPDEAWRKLPKGSPERRIGQMRAKETAAELRATAADARAIRVERELAELRAQLHAPPPVETTASVPDQPAPPNEPTEDQFETYDAYIRAVVDYRAEQKALAAVETRFASERQRLAQIDADRQQREILTAHQQRFAKAATDIPDFKTVTEQDLPVSPPMTDMIVRSPFGPQIAYHLGTHPEECARIAALPPAVTLIAMGRLEAQLETATSGPAPVASRVSTAPPVIRPVTGGAHASTVDEDSLPMVEYIRRKNLEDRAAGRL